MVADVVAIPEYSKLVFAAQCARSCIAVVSAARFDFLHRCGDCCGVGIYKKARLGVADFVRALRRRLVCDIFYVRAVLVGTQRFSARWIRGCFANDAMRDCINDAGVATASHSKSNMMRFVHDALKPIRGRVARRASTRFNLWKTLTQTLTMWMVFLCVGPLVALIFERWLFGARWSFDSAFWQIVGAILFVVGGTFASLSSWWMVQHGDGTPLPADCPRRLVIVGSYGYVRNPMAMGSLAQGVAVAFVFGSPFALCYALSGIALWNILVRPWEEHDLERRFGDDYIEYKNHVRCWIPRRTPWSLT